MSNTIKSSPVTEHYRRPRNIGEKRAFYAAMEDINELRELGLHGEVIVRGKRRPKALPKGTRWDDKPIGRTSYEKREQHARWQRLMAGGAL